MASGSEPFTCWTVCLDNNPRMKVELTISIVEIGTPKQRISLILDTGSSITLVDPDCVRAADSGACQKYGYYNTTASSTSQALNVYFVALFGTGYMEGSWYNDIVYVGQDSRTPFL